MRAVYGILAALLIGCAPQPETQGYRDSARPISSMAVIEQARLDGVWHEVAGFGDCRAAQTVTISGGGQRIEGSPCFLPLNGASGMEPIGPGRFRIAGQDYWLIWADFDYRTLVFGTPSGDFAAVLNRNGPIPDDRLEAARRVLSFNGYDIARLQRR